MKKIDKYHTVAEVVRIEHDRSDDTVFLVFEICDEKFKRKIKDDWTRDIPMILIDKKLVEFKNIDNNYSTLISFLKSVSLLNERAQRNFGTHHP